MVWGLLAALLLSVGGNVVLALMVFYKIPSVQHRDSVAEGKAHSLNPRIYRVISPYISEQDKKNNKKIK